MEKNRWMRKQFVAKFNKLGRCYGRGVSSCVVIVEEHIVLRQIGPFILQFSIKSIQ